MTENIRESSVFRKRKTINSKKKLRKTQHLTTIIAVRSSSAVRRRILSVGVCGCDWVVDRGNGLVRRLRTRFVPSPYTTPTRHLLRHPGGGGTSSKTVASMGVGTRFAAAAAVALSARERRRTGGRACLFKGPSELIWHSLTPFPFRSPCPLPDFS